MKLRTQLRATALAFGLALAAPAFAQTPPAQPVSAGKPNDALPGKAPFDKSCAACHTAAPVDVRTPNFTQLSAMPAALIRDTINEGGKMAPMAAALSIDEKTQLVAYLTSGQVLAPSDWTEA